MDPATRGPYAVSISRRPITRSSGGFLPRSCGMAMASDSLRVNRVCRIRVPGAALDSPGSPEHDKRRLIKLFGNSVLPFTI